MIDHVLERYQDVVETAVVVVHPVARPMVESHLRNSRIPVLLAEQAEPTGMLDGVMAARDAVLTLTRQPARVWITWCDQVGISAATVASLQTLDNTSPGVAAIVPVVQQPNPYIHFDRDPEGRVCAVRHRREGDSMPATGTSDAGLFSLSRDAFEHLLPRYAQMAAAGARTGERNFLPFLPWLAAQSDVRVFEIAVDEAVGINTPEDLAFVEARLRAQSDPRS